MNALLQDKNILIMGVANQRSIAWAIAKAFNRAGANLIFSYQGEKLKSKLEKIVYDEMPHAVLLPCDVTDDEQIDQLFEKISADYGVLHGLVHSIAYAQREDLANEYVNTSREGFRVAQDISAYSLVAVAQRAYPLMSEGSSIITLTYQGSVKLIPNYNVMGVAKASLEAGVRYLAGDLGPKGIRVNAVSAGPIKTLSAKGIRDFNLIVGQVEEKAPLRRAVEVEEVANAALFLASDLASGITGEVLYVDGGYNIMGV